jgi:hypothetical protein
MTSGENGAIKSIVSLGLAIGGLKVGGSFIEAVFGSLKDVAKAEGSKSATSFASAF